MKEKRVKQTKTEKKQARGRRSMKPKGAGKK